MAADNGVPPKDIIEFGPFQLSPAERVLQKDGKLVQLGNRALHILLVLLDHAGEIVRGSDLIAQVWPGVVVEDGNLRVHMSALRKALGDAGGGAQYITNIPGRGYSFVAPVSRVNATKPFAEPDPAPTLSYDLPGRSISTIGRDQIVETIAAQLPGRRFVTIVGSGGIGKTTVALAVANVLVPFFDGAVCFIDLGTLANPLLVPTALASKFGLPLQSENPVPGLISFLRDKRLLIVLDSCEPVIEVAAALAERIVREAPGVHVLATSRESLRVEGEFVYRLFPLASPPATADLTTVEILAFPAVQLFVQRATAILDSFAIDDTTAPIIAEICRRLDGIPLAIELAAARMDFYGVQGIAAGLNDLFFLLTKGRRTALPRHQTLHAALDWSYQLLAPRHQEILRRIAVFRDLFGLDSAFAIAASESMDALEVSDGVARLVATSLLATDLTGHIVRYRLLDTTRAFARQKLAESSEEPAIARRHAIHCLGRLEHAESDWENKTQDEWLKVHGGWIDDLRPALDWAFSPAGDPVVGIALTTTSAPLWFALSLGDEFCERAEHALQYLAVSSLVDSELELKLNLWLGAAIFNARGHTNRLSEVSNKALQIAAHRNLPIYQVRQLWKLSGERCVNDDYRATLALAERFASTVAAGGGTDALMVRNRMMAFGYHLAGQQAQARDYAERAIDAREVPAESTHVSFHQYDNRVAACSHLARILWVQGHADRATRIAQQCVAYALKLGYPSTTCYALVFTACPIAFWTGDQAAITHYLQLLRTHSKDFSFSYWQSWRRCYEQAAALGGNEDAPEFEQGKVALLKSAEGPLFIDMLATIREELAGPDAVNRAEAGYSGWCAAEVIRANGANLLRQDGPGPTAKAESMFLKAIKLARQQNALAWELRGATSLARLWRNNGRSNEALALLAPLYDRLTEGFENTDPRAARHLLSELR